MTRSIASRLWPEFLTALAAEQLREQAGDAAGQLQDLPGAVRQTRLLGLGEVPMVARVVDQASQWLARPLAPFAVICTRHCAGDYRLTGDDDRALNGNYVDATLDFSEGSGEEGQSVYIGTNRWVALPQRARQLAIVDRDSDLFRFERYLTIARSGHQTIYRLRVLMS